MTDASIEQLAQRLDKPVATLIVSKDAVTKRFIGEALLIAAAAYLLKKYTDKYLEGLGFDDIAKEHGRKTRQFFVALKSGDEVPEQMMKSASEDVTEAKKLIADRPVNNSAKTDAEAEVQAAVVEAGGLKAQGREVAIIISTIVLPPGAIP